MSDREISKSMHDFGFNAWALLASLSLSSHQKVFKGEARFVRRGTTA